MRLEVPVHDVQGVGSREALTGLPKHVDDLSPVTCVLLPEPGLQRRPSAKFHGHEQLVSSLSNLSDLVDMDDVGVREPGEGSGFTPHSLAELGAVDAPRAEQLDGDLAIELLVVGRVDRAHASVAERTEHAKAPDHHCLRARAEQCGMSLQALVALLGTVEQRGSHRGRQQCGLLTERVL